MKNFVKSLCVAALLFGANNQVSADDVKIPLVGEWTNMIKNANIEQIKFFPSGLLRLYTRDHGWSAQYKVVSTSIPRSDIFVAQGQINFTGKPSFADTNQPEQQGNRKRVVTDDEKITFTAKLTNHLKMMTLQIDNKGIKKEYTLNKTGDIKTGNIPAY
ncbi:hypothetical protein [Mucilaginibacter sp. CSA2-8R]|uniref:hypothetical protein n=1 Tax=Mucilaginibacter sp. CSA2-8R TaxID=3141542 RepID=UPI00315DFAF2